MTPAGHRRAHRLRRLGAREVAEDKGCEEMLGFATSAVRDAGQLRRGARPRRASAPASSIEVLSGEDEARLTFLAVRRWFGWSAGRLRGLRHRRRLAGDRRRRRRGARRGLVAAAGCGPAGPPAVRRRPPDEDEIRELRKQIRAEIARDAGHLLRAGAPDHAAATSKTFRSLARICGAAPVGDGPLVPRSLRARRRWSEWIPKLMAMSADELAGAARRLAEPRPPDRAGRAGRRGRAWTSSTWPRWRSARGRCARA